MSETTRRFAEPPTDRPRYAAPDGLGRIRRNALGIGGVALVVCAGWQSLGGDTTELYRAWLVGWLYWLGISLGCLALLMIQHLSAGGWGLVARRVFEAAARTLPLLLVLGVPLFVLGLEPLYVWMRPETAETEMLRHLLEHKAPYLNEGGFWLRFGLYFAVWLGLTWLLSRLSDRQDATGDVGLSRKMRMVAGPGLVLYAFAVTFAAVDWLMSLEPEWFSTIYGAIFFGGLGMASLAFVILIALWLWRREPLRRFLVEVHFHDYGKLMFAFVLLWTYFSFSQFLIIWSGNQAEEIGWFVHRMRPPGWGALGAALLLLHFAVPFALLLSRDLKRNPRRLAWVAAGLMVMHWADLYWQAVPALSPERFTIGVLDVAAPVAIGGLWLAWFAWQLGGRPVLAYNDPYLVKLPFHDTPEEEAMSHG
jgi:hypothetical protein